ncbi:conjugal transfer protein TraD, partial [Acinetobacter baumannii]|uniref:conjugal transfer protein TraD n=1 Tax=Acinetobacter baumannii TaxID=470 RepID=UPI0013A5573C
EAERKARTRHLIQLGALFEIANLDQRDPAELLGVLLKTAEIDPNDMKWQVWKDLGLETFKSRKIKS